tara:strand:+ start:382 stop:672 length:291 start_codon:yes stop_codon:yes gene_type:complete
MVICMVKFDIHSFVVFLAVYFISSIANILLLKIKAIPAFIGALFFAAFCAALATVLSFFSGDINSHYLVIIVFGLTAVKHMYHNEVINQEIQSNKY